MKRKKIVIAAGGTGGHLLPAQQLSSSLAKEADILFAGHALEKSPFFRRDLYPFSSIEAAPLSFSPKGLLRFIAVSCSSIWTAVKLLKSHNPDLVVGFGSFHAFPVLAAAALLRKKILLFEANCQLGKVNRLFAPFAKILAAQFPFSDKAEPVPLLPWVKKSSSWERIQAQEKFKLDPGRKTCLVFGGSQGALFLNRMAPLILPSTLQAIHLAGKNERVEEVQLQYANRGIRAAVLAYEEDMESAYAAADVAFCRAGASTIAELIAHQIPALLIPYPFSTDGHQIANARFLAKNVGGAIMMLEHEGGVESLSLAFLSLLDREEECRRVLGVYRSQSAGRESLADKIMRGV